MKTTAWYPGTVKPVRAGVYERQYKFNGVKYCYWSGRYWCLPEITARKAFGIRFMSEYQNLPWRGLMEKAR